MALDALHHGGGTGHWRVAVGAAANTNQDLIVQIAHSRIGDKFKPGANGPTVFDCSGLVSGYQVVTIKSLDKGFHSQRCGTWSSNLSRVTASMTKFGQGTLIVRTDITPGTYRSRKGGSCYWARLSNFGGTLSAIIANHFGSAGIVTIRASDKGFQSSRCGTWSRL